MALRCFVADANLGASWLERLQSAGFVTPYVVANGVDSGDELAAKLGVPASPSLHGLWTACDRYAELNAAVVSRALSKLALCAPLSGSRHFSATASSPVLSASRKRKATVSSKRNWVPTYKTKAKGKAMPKQQFLWDAFRELGSPGRMWSEYLSLKWSFRLEFEKLTKERLQTFSASCLSTAVSTYRRFGLWLEARNVFDQPPPLHVASGCVSVVQLGRPLRPMHLPPCAGWKTIWVSASIPGVRQLLPVVHRKGPAPEESC